MQKMTSLLPLLRGPVAKRRGVPQGIRKHSIRRGTSSKFPPKYSFLGFQHSIKCAKYLKKIAYSPHYTIDSAAGLGSQQVAVDPPESQQEILDMLVQP